MAIFASFTRYNQGRIQGGGAGICPHLNLPQLLVGTVYCQYKVCGNVLTVGNCEQCVSLIDCGLPNDPP